MLYWNKGPHSRNIQLGFVISLVQEQVLPQWFAGVSTPLKPYNIQLQRYSLPVTDPPKWKLKLLASKKKSIKQTLLPMKDYTSYLLLYQVVVLKIRAELITRLNMYVVSARAGPKMGFTSHNVRWLPPHKSVQFQIMLLTVQMLSSEILHIMVSLP